MVISITQGGRREGSRPARHLFSLTLTAEHQSYPLPGALMTARGFALLFLLAALAACAGGSTMRVAKENGEDAPVALAATPESSSDSGTAAVPLAEPREPLIRDSAPLIQDSTPKEQGYGPYGSSATVEIRRIGQLTHTGISEARRLVIRDANAWAEFWAEL